jgi:Transglycosylase SLT domain
MRGAAMLFTGGFLALLGLAFGLMLLGGSVDESCGQSTGLSAAGQPALVQFYLGAAQRYQLGANGYAYLAAINNVETTFGTNLSASSAGAIGWMQFEPGTFTTYGVAVSHPGGTPDAYDPQDAIYSAANYLHASGAPQDWSGAIFTYNHAGWYVAEVQSLAARYTGPAGLQNLNTDIRVAWGGRQPTGLPTAVPVSFTPDGNGQCCPTAPPHGSGSTPGTTSSPPGAGCTQLVDDLTPVPGKVAVILPNGLARPPAQAPLQVQAMVAAGDRIVHFAYSFGGAHGDPAQTMSQSNPDPAAVPGNEENGGPGYDCSSATSYVLWGGGFGQTLLAGSVDVSGAMESIGDPGPGRWVTFYANGGHAYIEVAGIYLDTAAGLGRAPNPPSTGPRWTPVGTGPTGFVQRHPPGL